MTKYAITDNLYFYYQNGKAIFKHIFLPNPISGKNSASRIRSNNDVVFPNRKYTLFDKTKEYYYNGKDEI